MTSQHLVGDIATPGTEQDTVANIVSFFYFILNFINPLLETMMNSQFSMQLNKISSVVLVI